MQLLSQIVLATCVLVSQTMIVVQNIVLIQTILNLVIDSDMEWNMKMELMVLENEESGFYMSGLQRTFCKNQKMFQVCQV